MPFHAKIKLLIYYVCMEFAVDYKRAREKLEASQFNSNLDTEVEEQGPSGRPRRKQKYVLLFLILVANSNRQIYCGIIYVHCKYFILCDLNMLAHI